MWDNEDCFKTIEEIKSEFEKFDGFGHTVLFRDKQEAEVIKNINGSCVGDCSVCFRNKFCNSSVVDLDNSRAIDL